jgi:hypothetical protein
MDGDVSDTTLQRLDPAAAFFEGPEGAWLVLLPDGTFISVEVTEPQRRELLPVLDGQQSAVDALRHSADPDAVRELIDAFAEHGLLVPVLPLPTAAPPTAARVVVEGETPVAGAVSDLLRRCGVAVDARASVTSAAVGAGSDLLISCAGWLPDHHWRALDRERRDAPFRWLTCFAEGRRVFIGPAAVDEQSVGYEDVRDRRLAAAANPPELEAYWRYLDAGERLPPVPWPGPEGVALIAAIIVADALALLRGEPPISDGNQLEVEPATLTVVRHPVLPVPRNLLQALPV